MVYRLTLSYFGAPFAGWQRQPGERTVQGEVEAAVAEIVRRPVTVVGSGRTDAGVHARGQVAHFEIERPVPLRALVAGTNHFLVEEIRVLDAALMPDRFHARKCAASKLYSYRLSRQEVLSPLDAPFMVRVDREIDAEAMQRAARQLVGEWDFAAFALSGGASKTTRRRVLAAGWREVGTELVFEIRGEGFLRGMVRSIVGTLLEVGRGRRAPEEIGRLLAGAERSAAGPTAPAHGLVLESVEYPESCRPLRALDAASEAGSA